MDEKKQVGKTILERIKSFQDDMKDIEIMKTTEGYGYNYADLKVIIDVISPILDKHKLWYSHDLRSEPQTKEQVVLTKIYCTDAEHQFKIAETVLSKDAVLPKQNTFMTIGSGITYFRRYHVVALLGLLTEEDTDAGGKREKPQVQKSNQQKSSQPVKSDGSKLVEQFEKMIKSGRPKDKVEKNLNMYKNQLSNSELKKINELITSSYDKK